ncbi:MAG: cell division protein ZapE [Rudaea sp.]|nr:cell division protein ZapE [Rudaea sp.]
MADTAVQGARTTPSDYYRRGVAAGRWEDDPAQHSALAALDRIHAELIAAHTGGSWQQRWWRRMRSRLHADPVRGLYLWGAVGRGKTFLVDLFFQALPFEQKLRLHFHRFMGRVHAGLNRAEGRPDPLEYVATQFAAQARVLCLDEFFVTDIGDAMILAGLLRHLFARGVSLVTTSNIVPSQLYPDGLQRAKFLPAIALIEQQCQVLELLSPQDYRLRALTSAGVYFTPLGEVAERGLAACFDRIAPGARRPEEVININDRAIAVRLRADGVIWFDFGALCEGPRAVADYIELARSFNTVLISGVPQFSAQTDDAARRFVELVDEFYDRGVNLVLSAATPITQLYEGERLGAQFARTQSRLIEMQSTEYLAGAHRH